MLLPGAPRNSGDLFEFYLGNKLSPECAIRICFALHYAARVSWQRHSDESELVRVGPSRESEFLGIVVDGTFDLGTLFRTDLSLERFAYAPEGFPIKYGRPTKLMLSRPLF